MATEYLAGCFKSVSLGLLALNGDITMDDAIRYSRIEENCQIEEYGLVEGAHDIEQAQLEVNSYSCKLVFDLAKSRL